MATQQREPVERMGDTSYQGNSPYDAVLADEELAVVVAVYTCVGVMITAIILMVIGAFGGLIYLLKGRKG